VISTEEERAQGPLQYRVICSWCGETIRWNAYKDLEAMCLSCYHRLLFERTRNVASPPEGAEGVSER